MKKSRIATAIIALFVIPLTLILGSKLPGRGFYLISTLVIIEILIPFFLAFEGRKPQARELVIIAVMSALSVAARVAIPIPAFKAIFAMIMISGIALGPESGFLVGAVAALGSNFFYGQGPYTPWQMMAYGVAGMLSGLLFEKGWLKRTRIRLAVYGFACVLCIIGPLLDSCSVFLMATELTWEFVATIFASGLPVNFSQSISTALVMFLLAEPMLEKLDRVKQKFAIGEEADGI